MSASADESLGKTAGPGDHVLRLKQRASLIFEDDGGHADTREAPVSEELLVLQEQILHSTIEIHGWLDKRSVAAIANYAILLRRAGSPKALGICSAALECSSAFYGLAHQKTLLIAKDNIDALMDAGKFESAEALTKDVLRALGAENNAHGQAKVSKEQLLQEYWRFNCTLVNILFVSGKKALCNAALDRMVESYRSVLDMASFPPLVSSMTRILIKLARYDEASRVLEDLVLVQQTAVLPHGRPSVLLAHNCADLALCHLRRSNRPKYPAAKELMETALTILSHHKRTAGSRSLYHAYMLYAEILDVLGKGAEASLAVSKAKSIFETSRASKHAGTLVLTKQLATREQEHSAVVRDAQARRQRVVRPPLGAIDGNRPLLLPDADKGKAHSCPNSRLPSVSGEASVAAAAAAASAATAVALAKDTSRLVGGRAAAMITTAPSMRSRTATFPPPAWAGNLYDTTGFPRPVIVVESEYEQVEGSGSLHPHVMAPGTPRLRADHGPSSLDHTYVFVSPPRNPPLVQQQQEQEQRRKSGLHEQQQEQQQQQQQRAHADTGHSKAVVTTGDHHLKPLVPSRTLKNQRVAQNKVYEHDYLPMQQIRAALAAAPGSELRLRAQKTHLNAAKEEPIYDVLHLSQFSDATDFEDVAGSTTRPESPIYEVIEEDSGDVSLRSSTHQARPDLTQSSSLLQAWRAVTPECRTTDAVLEVAQPVLSEPAAMRTFRADSGVSTSSGKSGEISRLRTHSSSSKQSKDSGTV